MKERRISRRHSIELPITLHGPKDPPIGATKDISRHGLFVKTELQKKHGELIQLWVQLPDQLWIQLMAITVRQGPAQGGMGLRLYMMEGKEKIRWERLVSTLEAGADPLKSDTETLSTEGVDHRPRFFIRPRSPEHLAQFRERELRVGAMYFKTPVPRRFGEQIELMIIHPVTDNAFSVTGQVILTFTEGALAERGNGIYFHDPRSQLSERFQAFCQNEDLLMEG